MWQSCFGTNAVPPPPGFYPIDNTELHMHGPQKTPSMALMCAYLKRIPQIAFTIFAKFYFRDIKGNFEHFNLLKILLWTTKE